MLSQNQKISVIIPSARPGKVIGTLCGLSTQTLAADVLEMIVVTPKHSQEKIDCDRITKVKVVFVDELYPPGKMRNIGARSAVGDYLAFIDDDCIPGERWLENLIKEVTSHQDVGMVGCRVVSGNKGFWSESADYALFAAYQYKKKLFIDLGSAAIMVKRQAFTEVAGFDESMLASEDWDFSLRLRQVGWRCLFTPEGQVLHFHGRESFSAIAQSAYRSGFRSGLMVQIKHFSKMSWLAKISVRMGTSFWYFPLILPYALALTLMQCLGLVQTDFYKCRHVPMIFICRFLYHCGVWRKLLQESTSQ